MKFSSKKDSNEDGFLLAADNRLIRTQRGLDYKKGIYNKYGILFDDVLGGDNAFDSHGDEDGHQEVLFVVELLFDFFADVVVGDLDVLSDFTCFVHEGAKVFIDVNECIVQSLDEGNIHVVCGGADIFVLLAVVKVDGDHVDFGVTVFACFGGGHLDDLAWATLHNNIAIFAERGALCGEYLGGSRLGSFKLFLKIFRHV